MYNNQAYYNPYNYMSPMQPQSIYPNQYIPNQTNQTPQPAALNGKIVDSEEVVRATEVPIGGYGVFPKADLSEIYIKQWNNNGTTSVITFKPTVRAEASQDLNSQDAGILQILDRIKQLDTKVSEMLESKAAPAERKEVNLNGY